MSSRALTLRRAARRRALLAAAVLPAAGTALALGLLGAGSRASAAGQSSAPEPVAQSDASVPAREVTMIGASSSEAGGEAGETWGLGRSGAGAAVLVRYTSSQGWTVGPALKDRTGATLEGFELDAPVGEGGALASPLAAQLAPDGAGVMVGYVPHQGQVALVREGNDPSNPFQETEPAAAGELEDGELLFSRTRAPMIAPLEEEGGRTGALIVPVKQQGYGAEETVLHWEGARKRWSREPIELPEGTSRGEFRVLGIGASSPSNAWLVAQLSEGQLALFKRQEGGGGAAWRGVALRQEGHAGEAVEVKGEGLVVPGTRGERLRTQVLTVTAEGVWIDAERAQTHASTTVFFRPGGGEEAPRLTSWCTLEDPPPGAEPCDHTLPEALPAGPSRSIAWAPKGGDEPFGARVITGLAEGVSLRLSGEGFERVLGLGGAAGSSFGAAFSEPREGWLGGRELPIHVTTHPQASGLSPWPVPARHALLALAPEPGASPGATASGALAVGADGEIARYVPGSGWLPEVALSSNGRRQSPLLRAVAWPAPNRAYAVGDGGQMWLWRREAERWEPDPAVPYQFEGNLLGIAFEAGNPARGYAVGESGVLLAYGKSWSQQELPKESPCQGEPADASPRCTWSDASFTSISFAGPTAIVAYRVLPETDTDRYLGGLIVNEGSGWHIEKQAFEADGGAVPWATAGLADGGAAFSAGDAVYERSSPGEPWRQTPTPFPGRSGPGALALFREGASLRVIASGSVPDTYEVEKAPEAPAGSPPTQIGAFPLAVDSQTAVLRQTASGWRDEQHELNEASEPPGNWSFYDTVEEPDPVTAVLTSEDGSQGWAVGGLVETEDHEGLLETSDVYRLRGEPVTPTGIKNSTIAVTPGLATFAIGGGAQCAAPCAQRARAGIGPDVWFSAALRRAAQVVEAPGSQAPGVRAFLYTGPRLVNPKAISGPRVTADEFSYPEELGRYAQILRESPLPAFTVATPTDLDRRESELSFEEALDPMPLGGEGAPELRSALTGFSQPTPCGGAAGCESAYYAFTSSGTAGSVRVIMLDDSAEIEEPGGMQRSWVEAQLKASANAGIPAIVVGHSDLAAKVAEGHVGAEDMARALIAGGASAYFFESPEENISVALRYGGGSIPSFGSGTLGYVSYASEERGAFLGASGFLLAGVNVAQRNPETNVAPVSVRLVPNIEELALEAHGGTVLRRSQAALFSALARRPRAGNRSSAGGAAHPETSPYIALGTSCESSTCAEAIEPEATFTSSRPEVGQFVEPNLSSPEPDAVLLGPGEHPVADPDSGLFCAYNKGETEVTISAGGLSASLIVKVQAGSVGRPCGTTKIEVPPAPTAPGSVLAPSPASSPSAASTPPIIPPPLAPAPLLVLQPAHARALAPPPLFLPPPAPVAFHAALVPPPTPPAAEPTPPSGTSAVNSPVEAAQREEEDEQAVESSQAAAAHLEQEHEPAGLYILGLAVIAALAGVSLRGRIGQRRQGAELARASVSTMRTQRASERLGAAHSQRERWRWKR